MRCYQVTNPKQTHKQAQIKSTDTSPNKTIQVDCQQQSAQYIEVERRNQYHHYYQCSGSKFKARATPAFLEEMFFLRPVVFWEHCQGNILGFRLGFTALPIRVTEDLPTLVAAFFDGAVGSDVVRSVVLNTGFCAMSG